MKEKRMDRLERLNIPYLKNVILKFVESTDKQVGYIACSIPHLCVI